MTQSRVMSAAEAVTNVAVGWSVALVAQLLVFPAIGLQASLGQNVTLSSVFTGVSLVRNYVLRRLFDTLGRPRR